MITLTSIWVSLKHIWHLTPWGCILFVILLYGMLRGIRYMWKTPDRWFL